MPPLLPDLGHQIDEQRIVVEHLLEMRHQPALIDRIARITAAEVIINAALRDVDQRLFDSSDAWLDAAAQTELPEKVQDHAIGEFRRPHQSAVIGVERAR